MTLSRLLSFTIAACTLACGTPGGPATVRSVSGDLTLKAQVSARGRDGFITLDLGFPDARCPAFGADLASDADGSMLFLQPGSGAGADGGACTLPSFRGPLSPPAGQDMVLSLKDSSGAATLAARAVYGGRTLTLASATAGTLHVAEEATATWQADQFALVPGTTPLVQLRAPELNEGGALMEVLSVTGSSVRFRVATLAAGHYKLALDGLAKPTVTRCEGAKACELTLDSSELASVLVDLQ